MTYVDPSILLAAKKKPQIVSRQRGFLKGFAERVAFNVGLFCTEVFRPELMTERIAQQMGIPLTEVSKFNVKGEVLIYKRDGEIARIPLEEAMHEYQRPECRHCGDFSAELADIACGGVGTDQATIVVIRTARGEAIWRKFEAAGLVDVWPIEQNKKAWNILQRLAGRQRNRVPARDGRSGTTQELAQYAPFDEHRESLDKVTPSMKSPADLDAALAAAYEGAARPLEVVGYMAGQPIPGDPGVAPAGEKQKLPPPPRPDQGGAPPGWQPSDAVPLAATP
jgi:coenzyme F420 hydrogenase subunit beta